LSNLAYNIFRIVWAETKQTVQESHRGGGSIEEIFQMARFVSYDRMGVQHFGTTMAEAVRKAAAANRDYGNN
jgi:hypothetical protein